MTTSACDKNNYSPVVVATHVSGQKFIEASSCIECHKEIYESHKKTSHYNTTALASDFSIGEFSEKGNSLLINDSLKVSINKSDTLFYHNANNINTEKNIDSKKIDIVIGSGKKGKGYWYWQNDSLYQLHASYFTANKSLIKSPGYSSDGRLQNKRPITERCIECHGTFAQVKDNKNTFEPSRILLGIDCQRCHGPSEEHVTFHKNNPNETEAQNIISISNLNRNRQMDMCALCHSGPRRRAIEPRFSFKIGDDLNKFSVADYFSTSAKLDVHGNQIGLLKASQCFQKSESMTCTTCHNPHENQQNKTDYFLGKCISCHQQNSTANCNLSVTQRGIKNCIDCHMPSTISKSMFAKNNVTKDTINIKVISHYISVYENK